MTEPKTYDNSPCPQGGGPHPGRRQVRVRNRETHPDRVSDVGEVAVARLISSVFEIEIDSADGFFVEIDLGVGERIDGVHGEP